MKFETCSGFGPVLIVVVFLLGFFAAEAPAQDWHGFVTGGVGSIDYGPGNRQRIGQVSTGALVALGTRHLSAGGQVDLLLSNGYATARGGGLVELDLLGRRGTIRPFGNGGYFAGEGGGLWIAGGGVELMRRDRFGIRIFVQDAFRSSSVSGPLGGTSRTIHEPSFQIGLAWQ
jgi:hypothetical protein